MAFGICVHLRFVFIIYQAIMDISFSQKIDCMGFHEAPDIYIEYFIIVF